MRHDNDNTRPLRFLSVCSGIEAASVAWKPLGWKAVGFSEIEPAPCSVLKHHYPDVPNFGDMTKFKEWPDFDQPIDLLCGGTPCQSFSVAGLRAGLADPRGNLALTFLAIAERYKPRWILWENVPGVLSSASHVAPDTRELEDPLDMGLDRQEVETVEEYDSEEVHAFNSFLAGLSELGYGWAYVVRDAQYIRVDGYPRAVPQRRRRVFVVGYLGDWRRAAAVLFEPESMCGNPPPRREAGKKPAPTLSARTQGGGGLGTDFELDGGLIADNGVSQPLLAKGNSSHDDSKETYVPVAFGGGNTHEIDVATTLTTKNQRIDFEAETFVAHALTAEGFDASEDGTGRGTPIVPVVGFSNRGIEDDGATETLRAASHGALPMVAHAIQAGALRENPNSGPDGVGVQADVAYTLEARAEVQAVQTEWAVRRLTPVECARLQGFPDDYLTQVMHNGKPLADGPMYKALGNSWPVNSVRWIGRRIQLVEEVAAELAAANDNTKQDTTIAA